MSWRNAVNSQLSEPHGLGGRFAGLAMLHRPSNRARTRWVLSLADIQPDERVLDIGIGPGYSTELIAESLQQGLVVGVDRSALMMDMARARLRRFMEARTVTLVHAEAEDLPNFNVKFDKVVSIDAIRFHEDPQSVLMRLHARMTPGGRIALAVQPDGRGEMDSQSFAVQIADALRVAGFGRPQTHFNASFRRSPCICVVARSDG